MGVQYKVSHDLLVAGVGTSDKYHKDWQPIAGKLTKLVTAAGFDVKHAGVEEQIRKKVAVGTAESVTLRAGANAPLNGSGATVLPATERALALKTVRHLYLHKSFGRQKVWILSLPESLPAFPMDYRTSPANVVDEILNSSGEKFSAQHRKDLSEAAQVGLAWVKKAMSACGSPLTPAHKLLFHRWFVPPGTPDENDRITEFAVVLRTHLESIAAGLKSGGVILTDDPRERRTNSGLERSEAFVYNQHDLITVYVEQAFFGSQNTLTGKTNWARIIVHELTHAYAKTKDHSYSWQGLLPRNTDLFKSANDRTLQASPGFSPVRTLSLDQCKDNADSWAFFCADAGGALSASDRMRALGGKLYEGAGMTPEVGVRHRLNARSG